jgi:hypothetical protein
VVWEVLCDTSRYPEWNSFVPRVTILSQPDGVSKDDATLHKETRFVFHVVMGEKVPGHGTGKGGQTVDTHLRITDLSTPDLPSSYISQQTLDSDPGYFSDLSKVYRISWATEGGFVAKGLKTERFHEIIVLAENECEVRTWECQGGVLARVVKWMYKAVLVRKFQDWCDDLKERSEEAFQTKGVMVLGRCN